MEILICICRFHTHSFIQVHLQQCCYLNRLVLLIHILCFSFFKTSLVEYIYPVIIISYIFILASFAIYFIFNDKFTQFNSRGRLFLSLASFVLWAVFSDHSTQFPRITSPIPRHEDQRLSLRTLKNRRKPSV
jgi:hypothetical protein